MIFIYSIDNLLDSPHPSLPLHSWNCTHVFEAMPHKVRKINEIVTKKQTTTESKNRTTQIVKIAKIPNARAAQKNCAYDATSPRLGKTSPKHRPNRTAINIAQRLTCEFRNFRQLFRREKIVQRRAQTRTQENTIQNGRAANFLRSRYRKCHLIVKSEFFPNDCHNANTESTHHCFSIFSRIYVSYVSRKIHNHNRTAVSGMCICFFFSIIISKGLHGGDVSAPSARGEAGPWG